METNITYNFDAFKEASKIMSQCVANLSKKNARQQIAAMAMYAMLSNSTYTKSFSVTDIAELAVCATDALIEKLNKGK